MLKECEAVRYELLRPGQVKSIREECPIAYMPGGSLEWHGVQNPLGTDGLKAHAICCDAALHHGGIVLPTFFLGMVGEGLGWGPEGWRGYTLANNTGEMMLAAMRGAAKALAQSGWKVIVGVTGHDVKAQRDVMHEAICSFTR
jgi:creatinine amidohydrolase/Fe(II)-dependent formamide hydrolase-like protein